MLHSQYDLIIIGAGPAGLIAAIESHQSSCRILILEKMHAPAMKLKISGKGRCNITNDADFGDFISHFGKNGRFLKYAFSEFFNKDLLQYFEKLGLRFKLERGGRYFPENDNAMDIVKVLLGKVKSLKIDISVHSEVSDIEKLPNENFKIAIRKKGHLDSRKSQQIYLAANKVVLATGGKS